MADSKISALPASTTPLAGTEVLPIVQSSATKQVSVANLTAGRSVSAADYVMSTGNLVPSTAARGINFTANTPVAGMTTQLLNWYEEGTFTPNQGAGLTVVGAFSSTGRYIRIGTLVTIFGTLTGATTIAATAGGVLSSNAPFSAANTGLGNIYTSGGATGASFIQGTSVYTVNTVTATGIIYFQISYKV